MRVISYSLELETGELGLSKETPSWRRRVVGYHRVQIRTRTFPRTTINKRIQSEEKTYYFVYL